MRQNSKEKALSYAEELIEKYPVIELSMQFGVLMMMDGYESEKVIEVAKKLNEMLEKNNKPKTKFNMRNTEKLGLEVLGSIRNNWNYLSINSFIVREDGVKAVRFTDNYHQVRYKNMWYEITAYNVNKIPDGNEAIEFIRKNINEMQAYIFENDFIEFDEYQFISDDGICDLEDYNQKGINVYLTSDMISQKDIDDFAKQYKDFFELRVFNKDEDDIEDYYFFHFKRNLTNKTI